MEACNEVVQLSVSKVAALKTPLAPTEEQRRIVAAIEEQFTRLDAAVTSLQRARANLKRYHAAVLRWLELIRDHVAANLAIERDALNPLLEELNQVLAA